jgi:hypothetical protein
MLLASVLLVADQLNAITVCVFQSVASFYHSTGLIRLESRAFVERHRVPNNTLHSAPRVYLF